MKTRKVYIGNGVTINAVENEEIGYYLDIDKLGKLIEENVGKRVVVGAVGDWFFTAQEITKDDLEQINKYKKHILRASCWSRFVVEIDDGDQQDCTIEVPKGIEKLVWMKGFDDGVSKFHFWVHNAYWRIKDFPYEKIKKCSEEIDAVIKKYEGNPK